MPVNKKPDRLLTLMDLEDYYWLKTELMQACQSYGLSAQGLKQELVQRLIIFFKTGQKKSPIKTNQGYTKDSDHELKKTTPVKNYRSDAVTREFFVRHIGSSFRFNAYLRQFRDNSNLAAGLTYGDLIQGYLDENTKNKPNKVISPQFEYNQFVRDYFHHESDPSMQQAVKAWKQVSAVNGPNTYQFFKKNFGRFKS